MSRRRGVGVGCPTKCVSESSRALMEALATPGRRPNGFGRESVRGTQRMLPMSRPVALTHGARGGSAGPRRSLCASPRPRLASNQLYAWPPDGASWRRPLGPLVAATMIEWRDKRGTNRRRAKPACPRNRTRVRPLRDEPRPAAHPFIHLCDTEKRSPSLASRLAGPRDRRAHRQTDGRTAANKGLPRWPSCVFRWRARAHNNETDSLYLSGAELAPPANPTATTQPLERENTHELEAGERARARSRAEEWRRGRRSRRRYELMFSFSFTFSPLAEFTHNGAAAGRVAGCQPPRGPGAPSHFRRRAGRPLIHHH